MTARVRWAITVAVCLVVVVPPLWPGAGDDFPVSTYPMFTADRARVLDLDTVVLVDEEGRHRLSPEDVGGTDEVIGAAVAVDRAIAAGSGATDDLCRDVAERVDRQGTVEVVTERHDTVAFLRDGAPPLEVTVHARCEA